MAKTGSVIYGVIADTHGYPSGRRQRLSTEKYLFDLGDNTMTSNLNYDNEPVEVIGNADMVLFGNHDTLQNGGQLKGLQILEDNSHKVIIFGLDSCTETDHVFCLQESQIVQLAEKLETLGSDWDVIVLTHIPLFERDSSITGTCWNDNTPENTSGLLNVLKAYQTHGTCVFNSSSYNYTSKTGNVIGCFCGHVHNGFACAVDGIYMEAFTTNGAATQLPNESSDGSNAGMYTPETMQISINFSTHHVNDEDYINPNPTFAAKYTSHPTNNIGQQAFGRIFLGGDDGAYPKFLSDGTYLGWGNSASGGPTANRFSRWGIDSNTITIGNNTVTASHVRWGSNGYMRFYATSSGNRDIEISNYQGSNTNVEFVSNGFLWNLKAENINMIWLNSTNSKIPVRLTGF